LNDIRELHVQHLSADLMISIGVGLLALFAAIGTSWIADKGSRARTIDSIQIETIAKAIQSDAVIADRLHSDERRKISHIGSAEELAARIDKAAQDAVAARPPEQTAVASLVTGYHEQALSQARAQFWFSVVAATVGFALIIYKGFQIDTFGDSTKILPGVVVDTVAFLFFRQASETRERATELYDRLRRDKQLSESVSLVSSIEDTKVRSVVKAQIALHMSGLTPNPIELCNLVPVPTSARRHRGSPETGVVDHPETAPASL